MNKLYFSLFALTLLLFSQACKEEVVPPIEEPQYYTVASGTANSLNLKVNVLAEDTAIVGYNNLFVELLDASNQPVTDLTVTVTPIMHMITGMNHSAPNEQPTGVMDGMYPFQVVFIMPSGEMGWWELKVMIKKSDGTEEEVSLTAEKVKLPEETRMRTMLAADSVTKLFVTMVQPSKPQVGMNPFEITVHKKATMMDFPPVTTYTVEIEPEMPTMGHGSPGNVNPVHTELGHYVGEVNFTMDGYWKVHVTLKENDVEVVKTSFDITF
jgi:hypothetical protein